MALLPIVVLLSVKPEPIDDNDYFFPSTTYGVVSVHGERLPMVNIPSTMTYYLGHASHTSW